MYIQTIDSIVVLVCQTRIWKPNRICKYGNDFYDFVPVFANTGMIL